MDSNYLQQKIYEAYRKLKNYYYYDNTSLFTRIRLAEFEEDLNNLKEKKFKAAFINKTSDLLAIINNDDSELLDSLLDRIDFKILPKYFNKESTDICNCVNTNTDSSRMITFFSNHSMNEKLEIGEYNIVIDAPIEIHLISTLWIMFVGVYLSKSSKGISYAYDLLLDDFDRQQSLFSATNLELFKPYYKGYQDWRDNAIKTAESILNKHKNATIVNLDIKRYYYNIRINLTKIVTNKLLKRELSIFDEDYDIQIPEEDNKIQIPEEYKLLAERLTDLLDRIHSAYTNKIRHYLPKDIDEPREGESMLPIGLISSGLLGNFYLNEFDDNVIKKLNPDYYGRYVDDMLFVISGASSIEMSNAKDFFDSCFVERSLLKEDENHNYIIEGKIYNGCLKIQQKKVIIEHFSHEGSKAALMKFKSNLRRQRSEFRFLPDEDVVNKEFNESAFYMQYDGPIINLRNIKEFREDKFGASSYLAHKIFLSSYDSEDSVKDKECTSQQIISFFKGRIALDFYTLWEKVFTYFIINKDVDSLNRFQDQMLSYIDRCDFDKAEKKENCFLVSSMIRSALKETLKLSIAIPLSMNLDFMVANNEFEYDVTRKAQMLRHANLYRHQYLGISGLSLTNCLWDKRVNLYDPNLELENNNLEQGKANILLHPYNIHYEDICHVMTLITASCFKGSKLKNINEDLGNVPIQSLDFYNKANYEWRNLFIVGSSNKPKVDKPKAFIEDFRKLSKLTIKDKSEKRIVLPFMIKDLYQKEISSVNKRIAIANLNVDKKIIEQIALGSVNLSNSRRKDLFRIINEATRNKCNVLVLPELSVPYQWLDLLVAESKKHNIAIIAGLTYLVNKNKYALNMVVTILPVKTEYCNNTCIIVPRVKNHYAPDEKRILKSYGYRIPIGHNTKYIYHLFHWQKTYFSVYNCYELASIEDRALLKSKVDFVIATELNRDIHYYSEIAGSWVRDIHSFFIQVNTSEFGDSRIMKPAKTEEKNMVIVRGGKNSTVLVDDIDIEALRRFQLPDNDVQKDMGGFKLTPPDYNHDDVRIRISNKKFNIK